MFFLQSQYFIFSWGVPQVCRKNLIRRKSLCWRHPTDHLSHINTKSKETPLIYCYVEMTDWMMPQTEHYLTLFRMTLSC